MSFLDRLFGKKRSASVPHAAHIEDEFASAPAEQSGSVDGPPEFVRAVEMQRRYWSPDDGERAELEGRGLERLDWHERLRLHHLLCMERVASGPERGAATEKCRESARRLRAEPSPYRPRTAAIWQRRSVPRAKDGGPDLEGMLLNAALTHLGCLEVYPLDAAQQPTRIDFVGFDELSGIVFAPPKLLRAAKLFYEDGRSEIVYAPLLYGTTWVIGNESDRSGRISRFVAHVDVDPGAPMGSLGVGVGQQDLCVVSDAGAASMFGLGSVEEIMFALDLHDPRFDERARVQGTTRTRRAGE